MLSFDIITLFPEIFDAYFNASILKRAQEKKLISLQAHNLRDAAEDKYKTVDDKPYGGGAGMVLMAGPILKTFDKIVKKRKVADRPRAGRPRAEKVVILSAKGKQFTQKIAYTWARKYKHIIFISGRYEGIDERVKTAIRADEISIGPYVLTDGDVAIMAIVSAVARLVPGVIRMESLAEESHWNRLLAKEKNATQEEALEYPHYTRPESLAYKGKNYRAPKVLLSGNHKKIAEWRSQHQKRASKN